VIERMNATSGAARNEVEVRCECLTKEHLEERTSRGKPMGDPPGIVMPSYYVAADRQRMSLSQAAKHASSNAGSGMFVQTHVSKQSWSAWQSENT
jgi:hypothetical protein